MDIMKHRGLGLIGIGLGSLSWQRWQQARQRHLHKQRLARTDALVTAYDRAVEAGTIFPPPAEEDNVCN